MAQQPRGRPPSQAPPPAGRGRNALTALGGGVLVLAIAGGAWALFGRDDSTSDNTAIGPKVPTSSATTQVLGPAVPGATKQPSVSPTSPRPVAATSAPAAAAPTASKPAPTKAAVSTQAPTPTASPTGAPPVVPPVVTPPVTGPQVGGTVAKQDFTFKVARGDTLWKLTEAALKVTGRSTSNANVAAYVTKLYQSNQTVIGADPDIILPGQTLVWPTGL